LKKINTKNLKKVYQTAGEKRASLQKPKDKAKIEKAIGAGKENELQDICEAYLALKGIFYLHIPASSYKTRGRNVLSGVPDLLIFKKEYINNVPCVDKLLSTGRTENQSRQAEPETDEMGQRNYCPCDQEF